MFRDMCLFFFFSSRRRHTRLQGDWSSDVCSSDLFAFSLPRLLIAIRCSHVAMPLELNESQTRSLLINPQLVAAGWKLDDPSLVRFEIPVDGYDAEPWNGITDYCLYDHAGSVHAVNEAKRTSRSPRNADEQLRHYVTEIAKRQAYAPFGFMSNGREIWFWEVGMANPRLIAGFFSPDDLQRMLFLRQHAHPLEATSINTAIV